MRRVMRRVVRGIGACVGAAGLAAGGFAAVAASPAAAQSFPGVVCKAHLQGDLTIDIDVPRDLSATIDAPTQTFAGTQFTVTVHGGTTDLPSSNSGLTIDSYQDLSTRYEVTGATIVAGSAVPAGTATINGAPTAGTVSLDGPNEIILATPGPIPPGTLITPNVSFKILAGAAGTTVTTGVVKSFTQANLPAFNAIATVTCPYPANTLTTTQVVNPPAAGAPNAVADVASTHPGQAVTIPVLANDEPDPEVPIDVSSLAITSQPAHGNVVLNADHTVTYTPDATCCTNDSFKYKICSQQETLQSQRIATEAGAGCTEAIVTVYVTALPPPSTTTTTVKARGGPTSTTATGAGAAPGARSATLPRTGRSSTPLTIFGLALVAGGAALVASVRRRAA
jgi:LPXTG-motif cell wall-anchored protein